MWCVATCVTNSALIGVLRKLQPSLMQPLLRRLVFDVPHLADHNKMALKVKTQIALNDSAKCEKHVGKPSQNDLFYCDPYLLNHQLLTSHYEQRWKYYLLTGGQGDQGLASEEELHLSRKLFWGVFKALDKKVTYT